MQDVSGFLASDGRFFFSAEECVQYESELDRISGIQDRRRTLISAIKSGSPEDLPECMHGYLACPEDWFEEAWNEAVIPHLVPSSWDGGASAGTPHELEILEKRLNFVHLVVSYVLDGPI